MPKRSTHVQDAAKRSSARSPLRIFEENPKGGGPDDGLSHRACGLLVADIFVGEYPRIVPAVLRLSRIRHLSVRDGGDPAQERAESNLRFIAAPRSPYGFAERILRGTQPVAEGATPIPRDVVARELEACLTAEEDRAQGLAVKGAIWRVAERAALRESLGLPLESSSIIHVRVRVSTHSSPFVGTRGDPVPTHSSRLGGTSGDPVAHRTSSREEAKSPRSSTTVGRKGRGTARSRPDDPARSLGSYVGQDATAGAPIPLSRPRKRWGIRRLATEPFRIGVGGLLLGGLVAGLASIGNLPSIAREVEKTAVGATAALESGVRSLLAADTRAGSQNFADALSAYQSALQQLRESTTLLQRIAARADPAGRFRAAQALLRAGERAAELGDEATKILGLFQNAGGASLTETLEASLPAFLRLEQGILMITKDLTGIQPSALSAEAARTLGPLQESLRVLHAGVAGFVKSHKVVLELLGATRDRQYLVMFQNNRELRPTGGFIGSFALLDVSRGQVRKVQVDTIYNPDGQLRDFLVPPKPLQKITDRWFTRDANWFADFRQSALKVAHLFERSGGPTVDGVLAVTPAVLEDFLRLTGPIAMPTYDVTVSAENVVRETQRLVTYDYDRAVNTPKAFIADLVPEILTRLTTMPRERWGELFERLLQAVQRKHLLVYFRDENAEAAVVQLGWGGALPSLPPPAATAFTDHLGRVEANIGGHKTDDLIEQTLDREISVAYDRSLVATVVVTRRHRGSQVGAPGAASAEDPARKANVVYERTFVPTGSVLLEARGFTRESSVPTVFSNLADYRAFQQDEELRMLEADARAHESGVTIGSESGFTTFGGWVVTKPEETTVTVLRYRLPFRLPAPSLLASLVRYELLVTHQPGHLPVLTRSSLRLPEGFRVSWAGPEEAVTRAGERQVTHTGVVDRDLAWGTVLEER